MYFHLDIAISLNAKSLKFVRYFINLSSNILFTDIYFNMRKGWIAIDWLLTMRKSNLTGKMRWDEIARITYCSCLTGPP